MEILIDKMDEIAEYFGRPGWGERVYLAAEAIYDKTDADVKETADIIGESLVAGA